MNIVNIPVPAVIRQSYLSESQKAQCEKSGMTVTRSAIGDMQRIVTLLRPILFSGEGS
jgi:hypothetical protein